MAADAAIAQCRHIAAAGKKVGSECVMMSQSMQSFLYGLSAMVFCIGVCRLVTFLRKRIFDFLEREMSKK